jgi:hypothetical protein
MFLINYKNLKKNMEEILKTTLLEFDKSAFIIDLVKHSNGKQYIRILQTIQDDETTNKRAIKINPSLLSELLKVLNSYQELIPDVKEKQQNQHKKQVRARTFTESDKTAIQNRYLRGVSIADLTVQFDCKVELIEQVLRNNNIDIVDHNPPKSFQHKNFRRKRK